ncbi:hypothetical protein ACFOFO_23645 [Undibacterium arcticum]|uniref:Uncharacterized protein n=1 Tax=Undibacterium arcticum TaxID=1762892 RepID=A0ABV7FBC1_9BURK
MMRLEARNDALLSENAVSRNTVRVKLYPHTNFEKIDRRAARHLYRLLQVYNFCLEDDTRYLERWATFWPSLRPVERKALALLVMSNSNGEFGRRLDVSNLPVELEAFEGQIERVVLRPSVASELEKVVGRFYASLTNPGELAAHLAAVSPDGFQATVPFGGAMLAYKNDLLLPMEYRDRCYAALLSAGMDSEMAASYANGLEGELADFLILKETRGIWE